MLSVFMISVIIVSVIMLSNIMLGVKCQVSLYPVSYVECHSVK
jgi:hypothetical protein